MKLTIGEKTIGIVSAQPNRDIKFGVYLAIKIPKDNITAAEIETLFSGNTETIVITNDDETEVSYSGYTELGRYNCEDGYYNISQICVSEMQHQINMLNTKYVAQEQDISAQAAQVTALEETSALHMSAIDSLLLDVIPTVVTEAVTTAVAEALGNSNTAEAAAQ